MVLIRDVDVGTRLYFVTQNNAPVTDDVRAATDDALATNGDGGGGQHGLLRTNPGGQAHVGADESFVTDGEIFLVINNALGIHHRGAVAKVMKFLGVGVVRSHSACELRVRPSASQKCSHVGMESRTQRHRSTLPLRHRSAF